MAFGDLADLVTVFVVAGDLVDFAEDGVFAGDEDDLAEEDERAAALAVEADYFGGVWASLIGFLVSFACCLCFSF